MNDDQKRRFDALNALCDHAWKEFENKSTAEWRLSLAIWAAVLGSAAAVLGAGSLRSVGASWIVGLLVSLVVMLAVLHLYFLTWIQGELTKIREFIDEAQKEMRSLTGLPQKPPPSQRGSVWNQKSLFVQFWLTVVVGYVLIATLFFKSC